MLFNKHITTNSNFALKKHLRWFLVLCQLLTLLGLATELAMWMNATISLCLVWQCAVLLNVLPQPNKYIVFFIAILGSIALAISGRELGLLLSMIHLICFAYTIKALELNTRKDFFQLILLGVFLVACAFIFNQSVWFAGAAFTLVMLNLSLLLLFFAPKLSVTDGVKLNLSQLLLSLPFAIMMFLFFPRLEPFWQMPSAKSAKTGLGNEVKPGDIASLALSDELAFRVDFFGDAPSTSIMYWRAMTLPVYDGRSWQRFGNNRRQGNQNINSGVGLLPANSYTTTGQFYQYQVIAEASFQRWLFGLDVAQVSQRDIYQLNDFSLIAEKPITKTIAYNVTSYWQSPLELNMSARKRSRLTQVPNDANPQLVNYARELQGLYSAPEDIINHVLKHFAVQEYYYTLKPPRLTNNSLDEFFFESKSGFCEHYASTFAFIMRAAGIPSRLVTGYLGAEYNPQGNYYSVYQYDAHAWVEVWLSGTGWVRVDPTASVSPDRITRGLSQTLAEEKSALSNEFFSRWSSSLLFNQIKLQIQAIDYQWTRLVVGYSIEKQSKFLNDLLGQGKLWKTAAIFIVTLISIITIFWIFSLRKPSKVYQQRWQKDFEQVLSALSKKGFDRNKETTIKVHLINVSKALDDKNGVLACLWISYYRLAFSAMNEAEMGQEIIRFNRYVKESLFIIKSLPSA